MNIIDFLFLLVVAGFIGAIGQSLAGFSRKGCLGSIALGFIGALIGIWLARSLGLPEWYVLRFHGARFPIVWSIIGAALFVSFLGFFSHRH